MGEITRLARDEVVIHMRGRDGEAGRSLSNIPSGRAVAHEVAVRGEVTWMLWNSERCCNCMCSHWPGSLDLMQYTYPITGSINVGSRSVVTQL